QRRAALFPLRPRRFPLHLGAPSEFRQQTTRRRRLRRAPLSPRAPFPQADDPHDRADRPFGGSRPHGFRLRRTDRKYLAPRENADVKISVLVVTRNEGAELRRTVENLRDTLPARSEIVIVDDASTDGSTASFRRAIKTSGISVARARNLGAAQSKGALLVFADGHIRLDKLWWQPVADIVEDRQVAAVAPGVTHLPAGRGCGFGLQLTGPDL